MTNSTADRLVDDYLTRLAGASQALPPDRRTELLAEIRGHIAAALGGGTDADEAGVRTMLDRLGDPADIVAAAVEDDPGLLPPNPPNQGRRPGIGLEVGAVLMLTVGSLIPVIGWIVGVILLWSSGLWRRSEKLLGTLIVPGGPGLALLIGAAAIALPPALGIPIMIFVLMAPIAVAIVLINRARARTALVRL
jgi:HAAS